MVCYEVTLFYADDCLWEPWQEGHCNCSTGTKQLNRTHLRNATEGGVDCVGDSGKIESCNCTGE